MTIRKNISYYDDNSNTGPQRTIGPAELVGSIVTDVELPFVARGIIVGVAGNINMRFKNGETHTFPLPQGVFPFSFVEVLGSGTTANNLHWYV